MKWPDLNFSIIKMMGWEQGFQLVIDYHYFQRQKLLQVSGVSSEAPECFAIQRDIWMRRSGKVEVLVQVHCGRRQSVYLVQGGQFSHPVPVWNTIHIRKSTIQVFLWQRTWGMQMAGIGNGGVCWPNQAGVPLSSLSKCAWLWAHK